MNKITGAIGIILSLILIYCYFKIDALQEDLKISESNNAILKQSIEEQSHVIQSLNNDLKQIQIINNNINDELQKKNISINNLNKNLLNLKNQYKKNPIKANNQLNNYIKNFHSCIFDITNNNVNSESCQKFY